MLVERGPGEAGIFDISHAFEICKIRTAAQLAEKSRKPSF
jgi:hypothetical protein